MRNYATILKVGRDGITVTHVAVDDWFWRWIMKILCTRGPFVCEHFSALHRSHFEEVIVGVDAEYFEALWFDDEETVKEIECMSNSQGWGPDAMCLTVENSSSTQTHCTVDHHLPNNRRGKLKRITCTCIMRIYTPYNLHDCPYVAITFQGSHTHPIPLARTVPAQLRDLITSLVKGMGADLADATPRPFSRYPSVQYALKSFFPDLPHPTLMDLHPSLGNYEHLRIFTKVQKRKEFPFGTDWEGAVHFQRQEANFPPENRYVRRIKEAMADPTDKDQQHYRIIVCMTHYMSDLLANCMYIQSDIAFKWVKDWYEFEIAAWHRELRRSVIVCRAFLNRHYLLFRLIDEIVQEDTGQFLKWRHLDSPSIKEPLGIFHWQRGVKEFDALTKRHMLSLMSPHDRHYSEAFQAIQAGGKKAKGDWLEDKIRRQFVFPAICKTKNFIPDTVWEAGDRNDNVSEGLHHQINQTGTSRTLLGGIQSGYMFDQTRKQLQVAFGIRPSYGVQGDSERLVKSMSRKHSKKLRGQRARRQRAHVKLATCTRRMTRVLVHTKGKHESY
ncbi:uncharacterized protein EI90DRAFT_3021720 [Cantharellus anzutake]|uniref:uncharacterized protein n=1 Tax=Cantharellus anzutake TaxID=1750568 RepID=UPI001905934E|nr:uncharacterized protein EI90DRAFT_3021720 [Cantharellus anzutake]KAF8315972.1 hypothetical protein EI90DRAFT_3021720 [Cantharellus anzutake]